MGREQKSNKEAKKPKKAPPPKAPAGSAFAQTKKPK
jgi:hypothetical protein